MPTALQQSNRGRSLESVVIASQKVIRIDKFGAEVKWLPRGKTIAKKGPVDFVGEVIASGRSIHFDAKQTAEARGFYLRLLEPHQLLHLERHAAARAIAGVLAECTAPAVAAFFWIPLTTIQTTVRAGAACVLWADAVRLNDNTHLPDFSRVPEIANG